MKRLPCCDRPTCRSEFAVFAALGFAGVLMVALAVTQVTKFAERGDPIPAGLEAASPLDHTRPVASKMGGPTAERATLSDLSPSTNTASPATPG